MKRKNLMLSMAAAAVLGAFNPAFAGGDSAYGKDSSASAGASSSTDVTAGGNVSPGAESPAIIESPVTGSADGSVLPETDRSLSPSEPQSAESGRDMSPTPGAPLGDSTAAADLERDLEPQDERRLN